jgi:hypothetical protein
MKHTSVVPLNASEFKELMFILLLLLKFAAETLLFLFNSMANFKIWDLLDINNAKSVTEIDDKIERLFFSLLDKIYIKYH